MYGRGQPRVYIVVASHAVGKVRQIRYSRIDFFDTAESLFKIHVRQMLFVPQSVDDKGVDAVDNIYRAVRNLFCIGDICKIAYLEAYDG